MSRTILTTKLPSQAVHGEGLEYRESLSDTVAKAPARDADSTDAHLPTGRQLQPMYQDLLQSDPTSNLSRSCVFGLPLTACAVNCSSLIFLKPNGQIFRPEQTIYGLPIFVKGLSDNFVSEKSTLGSRVREARKKSRISQEELASRVLIHQSSLSDIESGKTTPRESTLLALARELNSDFGEEWLRKRLASTSDWEKLIAPALWAIQGNEPILYVFVAMLADANEKFREMLKPEELRRVKAMRNELVHMLHVDIPPEEQERRDELVTKIKDRIETTVQDLGVVDEFDVESAVKKYDNPLLILRDWYSFENAVVKIPQNLAFEGWDTLTLEQKVHEIKGAKETIDAARMFEESYEASTKFKHS